MSGDQLNELDSMQFQLIYFNLSLTHLFIGHYLFILHIISVQSKVLMNNIFFEGSIKVEVMKLWFPAFHFTKNARWYKFY